MYRGGYGGAGGDHKSLHFQLEQVQDFTPTPMTLATEMYYTGYHPYTLEKVYTARSKNKSWHNASSSSGINRVTPSDHASIAKDGTKGFD